MKRLFASLTVSTALAGVSPVVNAQVIPAVTEFSPTPAMVKAGATGNRSRHMSDDGRLLNDHDLTLRNGMRIPRDSISIPNLDHAGYARALNDIDPRLSAALKGPTAQMKQIHDRTGRNTPFILAGPVSSAGMGGFLGLGLGGTSFERQFLQRYQDTPGSYSGMTVNVERVSVSTAEDLTALQEKGLISRNAEWAGAGKYMARAFVAQSEANQIKINPVDPYVYVKLDKAHVEARGEVYDARAKKLYDAALQQFDPQVVFGLPRDLSQQVRQDPPQASPFNINAVQGNQLSNSQQPVLPGVTVTPNGVNVNVDPAAVVQGLKNLFGGPKP